MKIKHLDYFLLFIVALLLILGVSFLTTISAQASLKKFGTPNYYFLHQLIYGVLAGIIVGLFAFLLPLGFIRKVAPVVLLLVLICMAVVLLPKLGIRFLGANRWVSVGGILFQPSEFLKLVSILYIASWLRNRTGKNKEETFKKKTGNSFKDLLIPFLIFLAIVGVMLILQPDISTLGIICLTVVAMYFVADTPIWHTGLIISLAILAVFLLVTVEPYRLERWTTFMNPDADPMGVGYHTKQAVIAIGSGGIAGQGLGMSIQNFGFLPQTMSDSTFAIYAEETGFLGCLILVVLFLMFLWTGLMIARKTNDRFAKLAALGITFWIVIQGFVNISSMIGLFPVSGIPLPFISYGGSHVISELAAVGVLLNIAKRDI